MNINKVKLHKISIFIKNKKRPLCEILVENENQVTTIIETINIKKDDEIVNLQQIVFRKGEFRYATIKEVSN